ncbi:MAG TPA: acyl-ACP--UDP-N-acetylglucosamine O-acyltransferase [Tepidisphaeraceae bacterium]|jgi:UDP-N-acetylglucosamine acyltransferase|nr:acyl-ACP--UDP-N-acetylglucosamine O-acyltransferase [Tepidisphaeraceae bacterium]
MSQADDKPKEAKGPGNSRRAPWFVSLFQFRFFSDEMPKISPHAVIDPKAEIAEDVEVGPFCVIGPEVKVASGCRLLNNVTILGKTTIGKDNVFFPNSVIGAAPQDKKFKGENSELIIGNANVFREGVTVHVGTELGGGVTCIGDNGLFMVNAHIGHDARIGNGALVSNNVMLAGHIVCENNVAIMGGVGIHHFVTVGEGAYIGGYSRIHYDVPPFCKVDGADDIRGLNKVGLRRAGYAESDIEALDEAYRSLFTRKKPMALAVAEFDLQNGINPYVKQLVEFLQRRSIGRHGRYLETQRVK